MEAREHELEDRYQVVRTATGTKYHLSGHGTPLLNCNYSGQIRRPRLYRVDISVADAIASGKMCRKCRCWVP